MTPEEIIKAQLDAYNARDIEAFMACWAPDACLYAYPDTLLAQGYEAIRNRHMIRFAEPDLYAHLVRRVVLGDTVVDTERVRRNFPEGVGHVDVIGIYQIRKGLIHEARFIMGASELS